MEKRVIIAVVLCVAVLALWSKFFPGSTPQAPPPPAPVTEKAPPPAQPQTGAAPAPAGTTPSAGAPAAAAAANHPERRVDLLTPDVRFVFSSKGATLRQARLRAEQFLMKKGDPESGHDIITAADAPELLTTFPKSAFPTPAEGAWAVSQPSPNTVVFTAETDTATIEKRFIADPTRYRLHMDVVVRNKTAKDQDHHLVLHLQGWQDPEKKGGGFFGIGTANVATMLCEIADDTERHAIDSLQKDPLSKTGGVRWMAADEKFFVLAAVPYPEKPPQARTCDLKSADGHSAEGTLSFAVRTVPARGSTVYSFVIFAGPKVLSDLDVVRPGNEEVRLDRVVDVTLAWLSRPILELLKLFHGVAHNWGLAIILLTVFIKLLTFYPTQKSLLSAKKMQKLAPKMAAIRKKFENDRQRQSAETMNLYKAHGVSPFGGCLPSLIQMPIWIALYSTLNYAVELYRAPFMLHINDLTAPDPFHLGPIPVPLTPLLMGGVMFLQMKMSPTSPDSQQQAIMTVMMPVMFTVFSLFLPSGLAVYMLTSYLIGIGQQLYVNHLDRKGSKA